MTNFCAFLCHVIVSKQNHACSKNNSGSNSNGDKCYCNEKREDCRIARQKELLSQQKGGRPGQAKPYQRVKGCGVNIIERERPG